MRKLCELIYSPKYMSFFYSHPSGGRAMFQFPNESVHVMTCRWISLPATFSAFSMREVGRFFVVFSFIYSDLFSEIKRVQCRTWNKTNNLSCLCVTGPHHVGWKHVGHTSRPLRTAVSSSKKVCPPPPPLGLFLTQTNTLPTYVDEVLCFGC